MQLLPHAEHIVVFDDNGHITEKGNFDDLNSADGYVNSLGLQRAAVKEIEAIVAEEVEHENIEKQAALEKVTLVKDSPDPSKPSRGKRNSDAIYSYIRTMGKLSFPAFCALTFCNVGFRSSQRKSFVCYKPGTLADTI